MGRAQWHIGIEGVGIAFMYDSPLVVVVHVSACWRRCCQCATLPSFSLPLLCA
jgi:hypothetical protein